MNWQTKIPKCKSIVGFGAAIVLSISAADVMAEDAGTAYTVAVISDAAHGSKVLAKRYEAAISRLERANLRGIDAFYAATNLCVAYLKVGDYTDAVTTCDVAVSRITDAIESDVDALRHTRAGKAYRTFLAIALSNRGVAHAVNGATDLARKDFNAALKARSRTREATNNLARLATVATPSA